LRKKVGKKARVRAKQYGGGVSSAGAPATVEEGEEIEAGEPGDGATDEPTAEAELEPVAAESEPEAVESEGEERAETS
jgi:hypothetical protein